MLRRPRLDSPVTLCYTLLLTNEAMQHACWPMEAPQAKVAPVAAVHARDENVE